MHQRPPRGGSKSFSNRYGGVLSPTTRPRPTCSEGRSTPPQLEVDSLPAELGDEVSRGVPQLEIERAKPQKENRRGNKARLQSIEKELAEKIESAGTLKTRWNQNSVSKRQKSVSRLKRSSNISRPIQAGLRPQQGGRRCGTGELPGLEQGGTGQRWLGKSKMRPTAGRKSGRRRYLRSSSRWTGIPVTRLVEGEMDETSPARERTPTPPSWDRAGRR